MSTIKDWLISIVGTYDPDYSAASFAQIDFVWILSAILLIVLVVVFFKALRLVVGGFVNR